MRGAEKYGLLVGVVGVGVLVLALVQGVGDLATTLLVGGVMAASRVLPVSIRAGEEHFEKHCDEVLVVVAVVALPGPSVIVAAAGAALVARLAGVLLESLSLSPPKVGFAVGKSSLSALVAISVAGFVGGLEPPVADQLVAAAAGGVAFALAEHAIVLPLVRLHGHRWRAAELASWLGLSGLSVVGGLVVAAALQSSLPLPVALGATIAIVAAVSRQASQAHRDRTELGAALEVVQASRETDPEQVQHLLTRSAATLLFAGWSEIRPKPPGKGECGAELRVDGRPAWLVVGDRQGSFQEFLQAEEALARSLASIGQTALDSAHRHARLAARAERCELTGLLNRRGVRERFATLSSAQAGRPVAVLFADLDGFKRVNDVHGHEVGDQLLIDVARRLERCVRDRDLVARWGGDEFLVVLGNGPNPETAHAMAERIDEALRAPHQAGKDLGVSASVGVACGTYGVDELQALAEEADQAMYAIKADRSG